MSTVRPVLAICALQLVAPYMVPRDHRPAVVAPWMPPCISALKRARDRYSRKGSRPIILKLTTEVGRKNNQLGECGDHVLDTLAFEVPSPRNEKDLPVYSGFIQSRSGVDSEPSKPWTLRPESSLRATFSYERHDAGRRAETTVLDREAPDAAEFSRVFQRALDECVADAPQSPVLPPESTAAELRAQCSRDAPAADASSCQAAELAAERLERTCFIHGDHDVGRPITKSALRKIAALGTAATPILRRLARSSNPAARAAAAMGLGKIETDAARAELGRLASDQATVMISSECSSGQQAVAELVKRALNPRFDP